MANVELIIDGEKHEFPVIEGSEKEKAIDISKLRSKTGYVTLDPGYKNTGATTSAITFLNGEEGILRYRGYSIEDLAEKSDFLEVAYLVIFGELPTKDQNQEFTNDIKMHTLVHEEIKNILDGFPSNAHPMGVLSALISALTAFYPASLDPNRSAGEVYMSIIRLLAKMPTLAAWSYKNEKGQPVNYPDNSLTYCGNFLKMMFAVPTEPYSVNPVVESALNKLLILHAEHEQNCSTSTVRIVGSSQASLYSSISAGVSALWGPLHGGANQAVIEMLENIRKDGGDTDKYLAKAKDKDDPFRLMGFGHRVYKNFDPRARIIKKAADEVLEDLGINDPVLDIAKRLEEAALNDPYFVERKLYPNVDFYSGIIYRAIGIPTQMFTVMFALGRLPGWISQWKEMRENNEPIGRPRQIYTGHNHREFVDRDKR
jgi:citrate synthase